VLGTVVSSEILPRPAHRRSRTISTALALIAVVLLILVNGFFVAAEFALVAVDRSRVEHLAEQGDRRARTTRGLLRHLSFHLSGAQLGITVSSLVLGILAEPAIASLIEPLIEPLLGESATRGVSLALAIFLATIVQMLVGELVPKGLAIARPETTSFLLGPVVRIYGLVFGPAIRFLNGAANRTVRLFGIEPREELSNVGTFSELQFLVSASAAEGTLADSASALLTRSIRFEGKTAGDVLVPRTAIRTLQSEQSVADLVVLSAETGFSRFLVHGADLDDVRGLVLVRSAHAVPAADRSTTTVSSLMQPVLAVPESRSLENILVDLRDARSHVAVVVDEYGGTAGIVTLEDVLEEIVGEIDDEHDPMPTRLTRPRRAGEWVVPGTLHPDEVLDQTGFEVPEGEYETIAGLVLDRLGRIPEPGDSVAVEGWLIEVVAMDRHRVAEVRLRVPQESEARTTTDVVEDGPGGGRP
jgi:CBS domain containing-hemolysin-like protein